MAAPPLAAAATTRTGAWTVGLSPYTARTSAFRRAQICRHGLPTLRCRRAQPLTAAALSSPVFEGYCFVVGENIDTDQIIPAEHLTLVSSKTKEYEKLGSYAFSGLPSAAYPTPFFDPVKKCSPYTVIIPGPNFGCGSSREHAPVALGAAGARVIVAESYVRIFFRNSVATGEVYPLELADAGAWKECETGHRVTVDIDKSVMINHDTDKEYKLKPKLLWLACGGIQMCQKRVVQVPLSEISVSMKNVHPDFTKYDSLKVGARQRIYHVLLAYVAESYVTRSTIILNSSCFSSFGQAGHDEPARASYSSVSMIPRAAKSVARLEAWNGNGHMWTTSLEDRGFVLVACEDCYGGMVVDADRLPSDTVAFARSLAASLAYWKSAGKKGVWLKLPLDRSDYIPLAVKEGFRYHHAEESYLMLTYWIPDGPCLLPANASHQVGVGGFVINDQMEVLIVQEKYFSSTLPGAWKLPTGFIHASEEIFTGAVREVKEETGIDTEFVELIAFRHAHNVAFQKSDLFFICLLRPWMPLAEFIRQPFIEEDHMFRKIADICVRRLRKRYCGLTAHSVVSKFDGGNSTLYYNVAEPGPDASAGVVHT
ncbi:hypothetical protein PR202_gb09244 [Eleusine coracana subsp. coracana]|uniref:Nudix hydrolase domain-containing protein n=1 Tax=Eleusine coracana subsp. coracana TaxID=191504 RepID=A0AAV5EEA8_ELECO|nr:hypothetical protein PR202_gb09244 [Eleusine coracana subsp. coracana]